MKNVDAGIDRILDLAEAVCDDAATKSDCMELDSLVLADEAVRRNYWDYCQMHVMLEMDSRLNRALQKVQNQSHFNVTELKPWESDALAGVTPPMPTSILTPPLGLFAGICHNTVGFFSQEIPFALLVATLITGLGLWAGSLIYVSHHQQIADGKLPPPPHSPLSSKPRVESEYIGRITGMVDVKWSDATTAAVTELVALNRKYALASGLMEITYDTGAKVILQGPCTYQADSRDGGFLSVGKLTARLEKKQSAVSGQQSEKVASGHEAVASESDSKSQNSEIPKSPASSPQAALTLTLSQRERGPDTNPQSLIPNPSASPAPRPQSHDPMFAVRTPTATITDLGTEFGVEVANESMVETTVFEGKVVLTIKDNHNFTEKEKVLRAGETVQVATKDGNTSVHVVGTQPSHFIRFQQSNRLLISQTLNNGSFEDPVVGPSNRTYQSGSPFFVDAMVAAFPTQWHGPITLQTQGNENVHGVTGRQFALLDHAPQGGVEMWCTLAEKYRANSIYTLSAHIGSNKSSKNLTVRFEDTNRTVSFSRRVITCSNENTMDTMPYLVLETALHPEFIGKSIRVTFLNDSPRNPGDRYQIYIDNVMLKVTSHSSFLSSLSSAAAEAAANRTTSLEDAQ